MKKYFYLKLNPPRPSFGMDMSEEERNTMLKHIVYWKAYVDNGSMIVMRPVMDPDGMFGVGVIGVKDEGELEQLISNDPANGLNTYQVFPIRPLSKLIEE